MSYEIKDTKELFHESDSMTIAIHSWGVQEGIDLVVNSKLDQEGNISTRFAGSLTWDEVDDLIAALSVAKIKF